MRKRFLCSFLLLAMLFGSLALKAEKISERIRINGFLSQGFVYSTENDFIPNSSENGSFEMSELGMTLSVDATEKLRFGFQLLARLSTGLAIEIGQEHFVLQSIRPLPSVCVQSS